MSHWLRSTSAYRKARRHWLAGFRGQGTCCLCGGLVDCTLPGTHPDGPTPEHRLPVRRIEGMVSNREQAIALACDTSLWSLAHNRCQSRQGAHVTNAIRRTKQRPRMTGASRDW